MLKNFLFTILIPLVAFGCTSAEKKALKKYGEKPEWAVQKPISSSYYYGTTSINKSFGDYKKAAMKGALDDLINGISVEVSSSSLLSTMETTSSFNQEYSQNTHLYSKEQLEGHELVGSWEDENHYYTCYRLSKQIHQQLKAKRIKLAIDRSKNTYLASQEQEKISNYRESIVGKVQALEILLPYLDQDLSTDVNGKKVNLAVEIVSAIKKTESKISLTPSFKEKHLKVGENISAKDLFVVAKDKSGKKVSNIPVLFEYKALYSSKRKTISNQEGVAFYDLGKIKSHKQHQNLYISLDFNRIITETSKDRLLHKVLNYQDESKIVIDLHVESPTVYIQGTQTISGGNATNNNSSIEPTLKKALIDNHFNISDSKEKADLVLYYEITSNASMRNNQFNVVSTGGSITIKKDDIIIFSDQLKPGKGTHSILSEAINESFKKLNPSITRKSIPMFSSRYFSY